MTSKDLGLNHLGAVTSGPAVLPSAPSDSSEAPVHVTVLLADQEQLIIQGGGMRLAFVRTGPASEVDTTPLPDNSSAPGR